VHAVVAAELADAVVVQEADGRRHVHIDAVSELPGDDSMSQLGPEFADKVFFFFTDFIPAFSSII
jgi:hypothetical protein